MRLATSRLARAFALGALALPLTLALALALAGEASARPGGGNTFSSGSSSYSGSSSSSGSSYSSSSSSYSSGSTFGSSSGSGSGSGRGRPPEGVLGLLGLAVGYVGMGVSGLMAVALISSAIFQALRQSIREGREDRRSAEELLAQMGYRTGTKEQAIGAYVARPEPRRRPRTRRASRARLREIDPAFSSIVFADLIQRIYVQAYLAAGEAKPEALEALAPYLAEPLRAALRGSLRGRRCHAALLADQRITRILEEGDALSIQVELTSNLHVQPRALAAGGPTTIYAVERWTFRRARDARTRPPEAVRALGCPNCGAPFVAGDQRRCAHCDAVVDDGRLEWIATAREVTEWSSMPPTLGRTIVEVGTDDPTRVQAGVSEPFAEHPRDDPAIDRPAIEARAQVIFDALTRGWNAAEPALFRPVLSDALFDTMRYWLRAYAEQRLRNLLEEARILRIELAKVERDAHYDALTLRVFAAGRDFTVNRHDEVVCGSRRRDRLYSEYWTLIRGRGARGVPAADACPSCAAPLAVTMAGTCDHCGIHLTLGEFDWVLSQIEQDEVYRG
ncbi:MAG: TIM44-like domain-containing protein [Myxococcales bacterium]|nr:TIM44-like domain-containing protein [Myxococcales bacterium]